MLTTMDSSEGPNTDRATMMSATEIGKKFMTAQFVITLVLFIVFEIIIVTTIETTMKQWLWSFMNIYFFLLCGFAPIVTDPKIFFKGGITDKSQSGGSSLLLGSSAFISWIFAKSIANSATWGARYGIGGGFAYAAWYLSFPTAAYVCYLLRKKGYRSLPEAIHDRYGTAACLSFLGACLFRLHNEVWSNARVIADFHGDKDYGSDDTDKNDAMYDGWAWGAILSTVIPVIYVLMGGMRTSLFSDMVQAFLAVILLVCFLSAVHAKASSNDGLRDYIDQVHYPSFVNTTTKDWCLGSGKGTPDCRYPLSGRQSTSFFHWNPVPDRSTLSMAGGMDAMILGLIQGCLSYPFFDPVLTDRCFLADPKTMARSFTVGGFAAAWFIVLFSIMGVYGNMIGQCTEYSVANGLEATYCDPADLNGASYSGMKSGKPQEVSKSMGDAWYGLTYFIFMTTSISTLDSTFSSVAKAVGPDLCGYLSPRKQPLPLSEATAQHVVMGRVAMVAWVIFGLIRLFSENESALSATTIGGTMVMGIGAPIILMAILPDSMLWKKGTKRPLAFLAPFWAATFIGVCFQVDATKNRNGGLRYKEAASDISWMDIYIGNGVYTKYVGVNVLGHCLAFALWFAFSFGWCWFSEEDDYEPVPATEALEIGGDASEKEVAVELVTKTAEPESAEA